MNELTQSKDYILQIRVKNGPMLRAIRAAGFASVSALSRACGIPQTVIGKFLNLKDVPLGRKGWSPAVLALSGFLKVMPEDLFPPQHIAKRLDKNFMEVDISANEVKAIMDWGLGFVNDRSPEDMMIADQNVKALMGAVATLPPRQEWVLRKHFGIGCEEKTLEEIGKELGVTQERVRQIECKAFRILQHPQNRRKLRELTK